MSDSDGSPQRDDHHHCSSPSRSPVSPRCAGETLAEWVERRLTEAAVPVGPLAGQPRAALATRSCGPMSPRRLEGPLPPPRPRALPPRPLRGPQAHRELRPQPQQAAPQPRRTTPRPPARRQRTESPRHGPRAPRRGSPQLQRGAGRVRGTAPTPAPATPTPAPQSRTPPRPPSLRGGRGLSALLKPVRMPPGVTLP